jgi:type IV secretory pathway VirB4 component
MTEIAKAGFGDAAIAGRGRKEDPEYRDFFKALGLTSQEEEVVMRLIEKRRRQLVDLQVQSARGGVVSMESIRKQQEVEKGSKELFTVKF